MNYYPKFSRDINILYISNRGVVYEFPLSVNPTTSFKNITLGAIIRRRNDNQPEGNNTIVVKDEHKTPSTKKILYNMEQLHLKLNQLINTYKDINKTNWRDLSKFWR